jgi:hypothetical protein
MEGLDAHKHALPAHTRTLRSRHLRVNTVRTLARTAKQVGKTTGRSRGGGGE